MARCLDALSPDERGWGATIDGIGGIEKTALSLKVAVRAREQAWFDAYIFVTAKTSWLSPRACARKRWRSLCWTPFRESIRLLERENERQITDALERRHALLDALRGRRALLVWDNLENLTADERDLIAEFLRKLPAPNKAIITSRYRTGESACAKDA